MHIWGDMRQIFGQQLRATTVAMKLMEILYNVRCFGNNQYLYKRKGILRIPGGPAHRNERAEKAGDPRKFRGRPARRNECAEPSGDPRWLRGFPARWNERPEPPGDPGWLNGSLARQNE